MNREIKRRIFAMTLAGSMILAPKKVYAAEITNEGEINSGIENSLCSSEVLE